MVNFDPNAGEFQINTSTTNNQQIASVTGLIDGGFVVVWASEEQDLTTPNNIYGQRYDASGKKVGGEFLINTQTTGDQWDPCVTALGSGGFVVTWESSGSSGYDIFGQNYDASGQKVGGEFLINTHSTGDQWDVCTTALTSGGFVVTWESGGYAGQDGSKNGIYGQRYDANGSRLGTEFQINTYTIDDQDHVSATALTGGGFVVTWESYGQDGSKNGIYGQRYDGSGNRLGSEFRINTFTVDDQDNPSVAALSGGGFVVVWESYGQDGPADNIIGQRYSADGNRLGGEFRINTYVENMQALPTVAGLKDGGFIVTWNSMNQVAPGLDVYAQRYDANGSRVGSEFQINTYINSTQGVHKGGVTGLTDGGFVVAWQSDGQDGSGYGIFGQRYDANGIPSALKPAATLFKHDNEYADGRFASLAGFAQAAYINKTNGKVNPDDWQGWTPMTAAALGMPSTGTASYAEYSGGNPTYYMRPGIFEYYPNHDSDESHPVALVARCGDALMISFRGTVRNDPFEPATDDDEDWFDVNDRYSKFKDLIDHVDSYVKDPANCSIKTVYVTGHSLGGGVAEEFMHAHKDTDQVKYEAVVFASPGASILNNELSDDKRIIAFEIDGDLTPDKNPTGHNAGTTLHFSHDNAGQFVIEKGDFHGITLYRSLTESLERDAFPLGGLKSRDTGTASYKVMVALRTVDGVVTNNIAADNTFTEDNFFLFGGDGHDTLKGGLFGNVLYGNKGNDKLYGLASPDRLYGGAGNDILDGGSGGDIMDGDIGNDIYYVGTTGDVTIEKSNLATEIDTVMSSVSWTLGANFERLFLIGAEAINGAGNALNNTLIGNENANVLHGGGGADTMLGKGGNDTYYVDVNTDKVHETTTTTNTVNAGGTDRVISTIPYALGLFVENLYLAGSAAINGTGNALNNTLLGNGAANALNGAAGTDIMLGMAGNDIYYVDVSTDRVYETTSTTNTVNAGGTDQVISTASYTLSLYVENLVLTGSAAINGTGNPLNNTLLGNGAANILNGGSGTDTMLGMGGNDTYYVDLGTDKVYETTTTTSRVDAGGVDRVVSSVSYALGTFLENLTLAGTAAINGSGNNLNNSLLGNASANILSGAAGNDSLNGVAGNDILAGGLGNDNLFGGAGKDTFFFNTTLNATTNRDAITDFSVVDDTIRLSRTIFTKLTTLGTLNSGWFRASTAGRALDSNDYLLYNTTTGGLFYDTDATGAGAATQFATLTTKPTITAADFAVVA